jgi:hypothetical protein
VGQRTFTRVLAALDADALDTAICRWLIAEQAGGPASGRQAFFDAGGLVLIRVRREALTRVRSAA